MDPLGGSSFPVLDECGFLCIWAEESFLFGRGRGLGHFVKSMLSLKLGYGLLGIPIREGGSRINLFSVVNGI